MSSTLGSRLRDARLSKGLSLRSVAAALDVSASLISQVEIGKTQPSVSTLFGLANHLGVSLDQLIAGDADGSEPSTPTEHRAPPPEHQAPPAEPRALPAEHLAPQMNPGAQSSDAVQRGDQNPVIEMENGVRWERLASTTGPADALLVTYAPGASSSIEGKLMRHAGFEYAYLIEGELTMHLEFEKYVLRAGDSLHFDSVRPHMFANEGSTIARGVWVIVGRRQQNLEMRAAPTTDAAATSSSPVSAVGVLRSWDDLVH